MHRLLQGACAQCETLQREYVKMNPNNEQEILLVLDFMYVLLLEINFFHYIGGSVSLTHNQITTSNTENYSKYT
jgi:hypothetical protein